MILEKCPACQNNLIKVENPPYPTADLAKLVSENAIIACDFYEFENLPLSVCVHCDPEWNTISSLIVKSLELERQFYKAELSCNNVFASLKLLDTAEQLRQEALCIATQLIEKSN